MTLFDTLRHRPAVLLMGLGLISGSLSAAWGEAFTLGGLQPLGMVFLLDPAALPIGFFYGAALGLGMALAMRKTWAAILVPVTTLYAWSAAVHTAIRLQRNSGDDVHLVAASLGAGAVGAGLTLLAAHSLRPTCAGPGASASLAPSAQRPECSSSWGSAKWWMSASST